MLETLTRRLVAGFVATAVFTVVALVGGMAPAHAAPSGYLLMKGTGSVYTANSIVNQGGIPGGTARTFSFKMVNTGSTSQQFKVTVATYNSGMTATLLRGSTVLQAPYYTAPIAPGGNLILTLKIQLAAGVPQGEYIADVSLRDPETNTALDTAFADVNATYQTGNTGHDLFLKTGTQPFVGGSFSPQYETASTLNVGNTATFVLRMQNNSGAPRAISLKSFPNGSCPSAFSVVVKQGTTDVTAAVAAGTYTTGVLAPGARKEVKVSVKLVSATTCTAAYFTYTASGPAGSSMQSAHVVTGA